MRILAQTARQRHGAFVASVLGPVITAIAVLWTPMSAEAQAGEIRCSVTANGAPASGTIVVERDGREAAGGSCGIAISVPAGKWRATVRLDGALDNPSKRVDVDVTAGKTTPVRVNFQTGVLEVRIEAKGGSGTGMVTVNRGSKRIGTLGAGVAAQLSAGNYEVVVRYGGQERRYAVNLRPGQHRVVRAQF
ncbi:MAG: hypothetical protein O7F08_03040 [Deltaproteobacteria bacterium]|nr:hypothetical protein [Deltaproteobacteria bacterium]